MKDVAKLLKKSPRWVRGNLPIILHGPRSRHVRVVDIQQYQEEHRIEPNK